MSKKNLYFNPTSVIKEGLTKDQKENMFSNIQIEIDGLNWTITRTMKKKDLFTGELINKTENVAECELYKDENNLVWVNKIISYGIYQGDGVGTEIIKLAVKEYGTIYISNANQGQKAAFSKDKKNDFRYFNDAINFEDSHIGLFASSLVKKGILSEDNIKNPYQI